jgi:hypothetical protein
MKKIWTLIAAGALIAGIVGYAGAQGAGPKGQKGGPQAGADKPGGPRQGGPRASRMQAELFAKIQPPLSADQKKKVEALNKSFGEQIRKLMEAPGERESKREKFMALRKKHQEEIAKILNKQQQESLKKLMEEARKRRGQNGGPNGVRKPGGQKPGGGKPGGQKPPL